MVDTNGGHIYMYTLAFKGHIYYDDAKGWYVARR